MEGIGAGSIVRRKDDGSHEFVTDEVAIEEPLEMRINGSAIATTMRTPGNDEELAAGFLLSEGIVRTRADLRAIAPCTLPASHRTRANGEVQTRRDAAFRNDFHELRPLWKNEYRIHPPTIAADRFLSANQD
jgi:formate dehydrogenase assembly factor FdhD